MVIRNATIDDASTLGKWWRDGKVMAHAGFPTGLAVSDDEIKAQLARDTDESRRLIIERAGVPIGEMNYRNKGEGIAEVGIKICEADQQNKGYGTRLLVMQLGASFGNLGFSKVILNTNLNNLRAQHVYEKLGFKRLGVNINSWVDQLGEPQSFVEYELTKDAFLTKCENHWYAYIYDQQENQTYDVELLLSILGDAPKRVLEVCCGTGRILVPLAQAGHEAVGFDMDGDMLSMLPPKAEGLSNIQYFMADALTSDWGGGFDVVVLAGNIMINIVTNGDYKQAQRLFIRRAAQALRPEGYIYLDFDLLAHPERFFNSTEERVYFDGYDDRGVYGRYIGCGGTYEPQTQMTWGRGRGEITPPGGKMHVLERESGKHIPNLNNVHGWLTDAGFVIEREYGDYDKAPISESTFRAIIYARLS